MRNKKKLCGLLSIALSIMVFTGCNTESTFGASGTEEKALESNITVEYEEDDVYFDWKESEYTTVNLNNGGTSITKSGIYELTGILKEGSVAVNVDKTTDKGTVFLVLNEAELYSEKTAPINITEAKKVVLILENGTKNKVVQGGNITVDDSNNPSAAIFSKADFTITGEGSLDVITAFNDGIAGKDELKITGGVINIEAEGDGVVGKDLLAVKTVDLNIVAGKDGMRATNATDVDKGNVVISDGVFKIVAKSEGIEGTDVTIEGGNIDLAATDDGINVNSSEGTLTISGGKINIKASGDGVDSNGNIVQSGGAVTISTESVGPGDSAVDYDGTFTGTGGTLLDQNGDKISHEAGMRGGPGGGMRGGPGGGMGDGTRPQNKRVE